jgi:hypothetical protein
MGKRLIAAGNHTSLVARYAGPRFHSKPKTQNPKLKTQGAKRKAQDSKPKTSYTNEESGNDL